MIPKSRWVEGVPLAGEEGPSWPLSGCLLVVPVEQPLLLLLMMMATTRKYMIFLVGKLDLAEARTCKALVVESGETAVAYC